MAIVRAVKSGNWSDPTVWNTGALPTADDDVYSNTFTVTIDVSPTVLSIRNASATGVTAGGSFVPTDGITLICTSAGVIGNGGQTVLGSALQAGQSCAIASNVSGGGNGQPAMLHFGGGVLNLIGNCTAPGGTTNAYPVQNSGTGTINITGNLFGNNNGSSGAANTGTGTINLTGNATGHIGTLSGPGYGIINASSGTVNITGNCIGGTHNSLGYGAFNTSIGTMTIIGAIQASASAPGVSSNQSSGVLILTGPFLTTANGVNPVYAIRWFWQNTTPPATYYQIRSANLAVIRPLYTADSVGGNPATSNVRSGTVYGPNSELTGTCAVPPAGSVALGVPVDNTTGTAAIDGPSIRSALGLASANLDTQLSGLSSGQATINNNVSTRLASANYTSPPTPADIAAEVWAASTRTLTSTIASAADIASAVWSAVTRTITGGTVDTLTNAPDVPTEAEIATAVRSELATELGRLDAAVSTRLAPDGTLARVTLTDTTTSLTNAPDVPTPEDIAAEVWATTERTVTGGTVDTVTNSTPVDAEEIATAVRTELTPELARVSNAATTQEVADIVEGANQAPAQP